MKTSFLNRYLLIVSLLLVSCAGCIFPAMWDNPGYLVNITVEKVSERDIALVRDILRKHDFMASKETERIGRILVSYRKDITIANVKLEHPYIHIGMSFDKGTDAGQITRFRILIMNEWEGKEPHLKQEIDGIADMLYSELEKLIGKENITITRKPTGPAM